MEKRMEKLPPFLDCMVAIDGFSANEWACMDGVMGIKTKILNMIFQDSDAVGNGGILLMENHGYKIKRGVGIKRAEISRFVYKNA